MLFESHFKCNYIHVRDVSRVFQHALDNHDTMKGEIYIAGSSDANVSKKELCEIIQQLPEFIFIDEAIGKDPDQRITLCQMEKIKSYCHKTRVFIGTRNW